MSEKTFAISIESPVYHLAIDEIWPDEDGPEDPTVDDVIAVMKNYGPPGMLVRDWYLDDEFVINVCDKTECKEYR